MGAALVCSRTPLCSDSPLPHPAFLTVPSLQHPPTPRCLCARSSPQALLPGTEVTFFSLHQAVSKSEKLSALPPPAPVHTFHLQKFNKVKGEKYQKETHLLIGIFFQIM